MKTLFCLFIFSFTTFAQEKTNNNDLRSDIELFSISFYEQSSHNNIKLVRSKLGNYQLIFEDSEQTVKSKIDTQQATQVDEVFSDSFIELKYMTGEAFSNECNSEYSLNLRGEAYKVCAEDDKRNPIILKMIKEIHKKKA